MRSKGAQMTNRLKKVLAGVAALAALALGGAVFANAQSGSSEPVGPDTDNIQQGDQSAPDGPATGTVNATAAKRTTAKSRGAKSTRKVRKHRKRVRRPVAAAAAGTSQTQGDQTAPDQGGTPETPGAETPETPGAENPETTNETSGESSGESAPADDGPGGHADEPGNPNADHQFQGEE
jgi:hypothetical protein